MERLPALTQARSREPHLTAEFATSWEFLAVATLLHFISADVLL